MENKDSGLEHIGTILVRVMANIEARLTQVAISGVNGYLAINRNES